MFGRREDEDPFAALKGGGGFQAGPTTAADIGLGGESIARPQSPAATAAVPAPTARPTATPSASVPGQPPASKRAAPTAFSVHSRGSSPGSGAMVRLVIAAVIIAAVEIPLISTINHTVHSFHFPSFNPGNTTSTNGFPPSTPSAPSSTSYMRTSSLRRALHRIAAV